MTRVPRSRFILLLPLTLAVSACADAPLDPPGGFEPEGAFSTGGAGTLDFDLQRLLLDRAAGGGLASFMLPASEAFGRIPQDPKNPLTAAKVALGELLYHETALAVDNVLPEGRETYSCASCHHARAGFQANVPQGIAEGGIGFGVAGEGRVKSAAYQVAQMDVQPIRSPTVMNGAYQELMLWNGQFGGVGGNLGTEAKWLPGTPLASNNLGLHGLETQAHAGMGVHRMSSIEDSRVASIPEYGMLFARAFPSELDPINRLNAALAIAAFERTVLSNRSPWQRYLRGDAAALSSREKEGAILFFGEAGCADCHSGPALNSMTFHAVGMGDVDASVDPGRVHLASGAVPANTVLGRGGFTGDPADNFKWKTPQLYNLVDSPFYGHGATFSTVRDVVEYFNLGVPQQSVANLAPLFRPLGLSAAEVDAITAFLENALYDPDLLRYEPERLPSGNCPTVNDPTARQDLGCDDAPITD